MKQLISLLMLAVTLVATAQMYEPVKWTMTSRAIDDNTVEVALVATIEDDWHVYGTDLPQGGPRPTVVTWDTTGANVTGALTATPQPTRAHDDTFNLDLSWWEHTVTLKQRFKVNGDYRIGASVNYQACNTMTGMCVPPATFSDAVTGTEASKPQPTTEPVEPQQPATGDTTVVTSNTATDAWAPVSAVSTTDNANNATGLWGLFWACFLGGLLALLTPCVWPIIPLTVSFFLKRSGSRARALTGAVTYGLSIIVIYVALGLAVTAAFGANALNTIATSAVCNIIFFVLLVVFAVSFFGAFELTLPASWSNRMDRAAGNTTGVLSIFFMAFTLVIVSFSCTGPIIGTLLVSAATGGERLAPAVGMLGFSLALALPFALFAMFPSWLKRLPRSGSWMQTVKIVLGFLELALSLKFLSVADLAYGWHILDREVFLALWIVIFALLGMYLLGMYRFTVEGDITGGVGVTRVMLAVVSLAFAVYLVPGLWGAPLRATSAFVPPLYTQDFVQSGDVTSTTVVDDYDRAIELSRATGKPVFIDFSGYGCVNCRKMEGAVLDREPVKSLLDSRFVTARLMVDDRTGLPAPRVVAGVSCATVGDVWSTLQRTKFGANSQPYYVVVDAGGNLLSGPRAYDENITDFVSFLNAAL